MVRFEGNSAQLKEPVDPEREDNASVQSVMEILENLKLNTSRR